MKFKLHSFGGLAQRRRVAIGANRNSGVGQILPDSGDAVCINSDAAFPDGGEEKECNGIFEEFS